MKILLLGSLLLMQSAFAQHEYCNEAILAEGGDSMENKLLMHPVK